MDIALAFRVALAKRQVSQSELARRIKVTRPFICSICNGDRNPSLEIMVRSSEALELRLSELIKGGEE